MHISSSQFSGLRIWHAEIDSVFEHGSNINRHEKICSSEKESKVKMGSQTLFLAPPLTLLCQIIFSNNSGQYCGKL